MPSQSTVSPYWLDRICVVCGTPFQARACHVRAGGGKYCSRSCYDAKRPPRPNNKLNLICERCGKAFAKWPSERDQRHAFCSHTCYAASMRIPIEGRFWDRVRKSDGCWEWMGNRMPRGYGLISAEKPNGGSRLAHRVSWELHFGPIPKGLMVCHACDNPPCVRPDHLFLGTGLENSADMVSKGRQRKPRQTKH